MQFNVVPAVGVDDSTPPQFLQLPAITPLPPQSFTRQLALIEKSGPGCRRGRRGRRRGRGPGRGASRHGRPDTVDETTPAGVWTERKWMDPVTENPAVGATEIWEFYNTTADAHPMHVHEVAFEVVNRESLVTDDEEVVDRSSSTARSPRPEPWESGFKDTVIAYPGQVTRVKARFDRPGQFVWHCHIVEHEDNEMMRPYRIGPPQPGQPD